MVFLIGQAFVPDLGESRVLWSCGCGAASPPFEEVGPTVVLQAASDGEQGVGSGPLEAAANDLLANAFHDTGSDRQSELPAEVIAHSVSVGLAGADKGRDRFKPTVRLQVSIGIQN